MTTDPIALLRDAENYLSALHGSVARHDHLAANLACAGCELRDRIAAALPELAAAASAVVAPPTDQTALRDREKAMLSFALEIAQEEIHARSLDINDQDKAALVSLRRLADETQQPCTDRRAEPIHCGLCLYGSDVGVPGYDNKGPAYTNPACPDHSTEATPGVCICGHPEERHFEDVCQTCGCGDYLEPQGAAEVIARWRQAALKVRAGERAAVLREEADRIDATRADFPIAVQNGITWATAEMRRHAAEAQPDPGARHVHITIHHPDPTTAHTAALCIADLVHGEYSDSLRLAITTDAQDPGAAPRRQADETPDGEPGCAHCGSRDHAWDDCEAYTELAADDEPVAGARQDGAQQ